jgi:hypothetical protein
VIGGFIRAQAAVLNLPHLTNDRRRTKTFPDVDFEFVLSSASGGLSGGAEIVELKI